MELTETPLRGEIVYDGKILRLRVDEARLPNGRVAKREVVEHNGGVCIAALTDEEELLFVRQYRYPYQQVVTELPAGKLERGEDPFEAGRRELTEETGASAAEYYHLGQLYPSPGYCGEIITLYLATGLQYGQMNPDEDEFLTVERIPLAEAAEMVMRGELPDAKTQTAVLKVLEWVRRGKTGLQRVQKSAISSDDKGKFDETKG